MSETSRHRGVRVVAGERLEPNGGWQPENRIYTVVAKREIATSDLMATDTASARAHADGGAMTVHLDPHSKGTYLYCIVIHFYIEWIFSSATISLTKRQLHVSAKTSLIARRALCQWNRMNGTIRRLQNQFMCLSKLISHNGTKVELEIKNHTFKSYLFFPCLSKWRTC